MKNGRRGLIVSILPILVSVLLVSLPRQALADESVGFPVELLAPVGLLDFSLVAIDVTSGARREWRSRGYGAFEVAVGAAQLAVSVELERNLNAGAASSLDTVLLIGASLGGAILVHGLITLVAPRTPAEVPPKAGSVTLAPVALSDVARPPVPGLALLGGF